MAIHPYDAIPELAGLASYEAAARVGWSVDENVQRLLRLHWTERRLMRLLVARVPSEPVWEVKCALALVSGRAHCESTTFGTESLKCGPRFRSWTWRHRMRPMWT